MSSWIKQSHQIWHVRYGFKGTDVTMCAHLWHLGCDSFVSRGKVSLDVSVKVHVTHDHPLLRAQLCASYHVFSQHVTSHIRASVSQLCLTHVGFAWEHRVTQWAVTQYWISTSALSPHERGMCIWERIRYCPSENLEFCVSDNLKEPLMFPCVTSDGSKSPMTERDAQIKQVHETLSRSSPGGDCYSYASPTQRLIKCGTSAAAFLKGFSRLTHRA